MGVQELQTTIYLFVELVTAEKTTAFPEESGGDFD